MSAERYQVQHVSLIVLIVISAVGGCAKAPLRTSGQAETEVAVNGAELVYNGEITHGANKRLFALATSSRENLTTLRITSNGGSIGAGIELGTWLFESGLNVRIPDFCVSSCANYVFVAGADKILEPSAMLVWHGGATQRFRISCEEALWPGGAEDCDEGQLRRALTRRLSELRKAESEFFEKIGVDQRITILGQRPEYDCRKSDGYLGWYYSVEDLTSLGVDGIVINGMRWRPVPPSPDVRICRVDLGRSPSQPPPAVS